MKGGVPVTVNDTALVKRLEARWRSELGDDTFADYQREGMGGEDFPFLTMEPYIPSAYFAIGGTPKESFEREAAGGPPVPSSPFATLRDCTRACGPKRRHRYGHCAQRADDRQAVASTSGESAVPSIYSSASPWVGSQPCGAKYPGFCADSKGV